MRSLRFAPFKKPTDEEFAHAQAAVSSLIFAYRNRGHMLAQVNPLGGNVKRSSYFDLERFGLSEKHLDQVFVANHLGGTTEGLTGTLREHIQVLELVHFPVEHLHVLKERDRFRDLVKWCCLGIDRASQEDHYHNCTY